MRKLRIYTEAPEPDISNNGVPRCDEHCRHYDGKRCELMGFRPDAICEPEVEEMAAELKELRRLADTAGDAEAVERAAFALVEDRLRGVDAATVTLVRDAVMIGTNKMWSERAESAYAAYRALSGKGEEGADKR